MSSMQALEDSLAVSTCSSVVVMFAFLELSSHHTACLLASRSDDGVGRYQGAAQYHRSIAWPSRPVSHSGHLPFNTQRTAMNRILLAAFTVGLVSASFPTYAEDRAIRPFKVQIQQA